MEITWESLSWIASFILPLCCFPFIPLLILPWGAWLIWFLYRQFWNVEFVSFDGKGIYVTGCDSGFGHEVSLLFDSLGFHVFAGCLRPNEQGANFLRAQASERLTILDLDITNEEKVTAAANIISVECMKRGIVLWGLYNNAGISSIGEIEWLSLDHYRRMLDIDLLGAISVTKSVLPLIRESKGRVVTITSGIARMPLPGRSGYCIPKAALECFCAALRYEMLKFGVKCSIIYPGNFVGATQVFAGVVKLLDDTTRSMPKDIRAAYGDEYMEAFRRHSVAGYTNISTTSSGPVVKAVQHAMLSKYPRIRYRPMDFNWLLYDFILQHFPEELSDILVSFYSRTLPKPAQC